MSCVDELVLQSDVLVLEFPACVSAIPSDFKAYFDSLPSCLNDTDARDNFDLDTNDLYWFSELTDTGIYNTLKRVSPL